MAGNPPMMTKFREFRFIVFIKAKANFEFRFLNCELYLSIFAIILARARLFILGNGRARGPQKHKKTIKNR